MRRLGALIAASLLLGARASAFADGSLTIDARAWRVVASESGPVNYYRVEEEAGATFVRSRYRPALETVVLGWAVPEAQRERLKTLRWRWRARTLPKGGDECASGREDSAAVVYVTWKRALRYYTIKYVWSAVGAKGRVCDRKRNPFVAQDTVIVESGQPLDVWRSTELDLRREFRKHFADGDPEAPVPAFVGIGLMSDGDQTQSESSADFGTFVLSP